MPYFAVVRARGPEWDWSLPMRQQAEWDAHAAFMDEFAADGALPAGGPLGTEDEAERVLLVIDADDQAEIERRLERDPWTPMRLLETESIEPWTVLLGGIARTQTERRNLTSVARAFAKWKAGTGSPFDLLADTARWTIAGRCLVSNVYRSKREFLTEVVERFNARVSKRIVPAIRTLHADGDTVIVVFDGTATAKDGLPYANTYSWHLRFEGDEIVEVFSIFDSTAFNEFWTRVDPDAP
jgi:hypothetical protein